MSSLEVSLVQYTDMWYSNKLIGCTGHGVQGKHANPLWIRSKRDSCYNSIRLCASSNVVWIILPTFNKNTWKKAAVVAQTYSQLYCKQLSSSIITSQKLKMIWLEFFFIHSHSHIGSQTFTLSHTACWCESRFFLIRVEWASLFTYHQKLRT